VQSAPTRTRVLLVEDDEDVREVFSILLGEKYAVLAHASAVDALQAIDTARPHAAVLDIGMHPVDGVQCLKMIRARPGYRDLPAVALTGFARDVERRRFLDGGFQAVVVKPILDHRKFTALIDQLVESPVPASPPSTTDQLRPIALPTRSAAADHLDQKTTMTASGTGGCGETKAHGPA
jgi:CheY-like chemotaxis protein